MMESIGVFTWSVVDEVYARSSQEFPSEVGMIIYVDLRSFPPLIYEFVEEVVGLDVEEMAETLRIRLGYGESLCLLLNTTAFKICRGVNE